MVVFRKQQQLFIGLIAPVVANVFGMTVGDSYIQLRGWEQSARFKDGIDMPGVSVVPSDA